MTQPIKFYQTGTFTVGNRLLAPEQRSVQASVERSNSLNSGHRACQGCGEALGARYAIDAAMRATGNRLIAANATGCLEVFSTPYPETSWQLPWIHSLFGNAAAVGTGIAAALKVKAAKAGRSRSDVRVMAQGGDGGTTDIGFGCLSGMFERNDDVLYICYDNEAYMNTGVQRSSATPPGARTATTMAVGAEPGAPFGQGKNLPLIAMAHEIPYVATATVADLRDLEAKVEQGHGPARRALPARAGALPAGLGFGLATTPSSWPAWRARPGIFPVFEAAHGEVTQVTKHPPPRAGAGLPPAAEAASRICSATPGTRRCWPASRPMPTATSAASSCWTTRWWYERAGPPQGRIPEATGRRYPIERAGPLPSAHPGARRAEGIPMTMRKPFAITLDPGSSLANKTGSWRTERPVYVDRLPPCNAHLPGRRGHPGLAVPCRERQLPGRLAPPGARQPLPGHHGPGLLPHLRRRLQPRPGSMRRWASIRWSASWVTKPSGKAGSSIRPRWSQASTCWSWAPGLRACRPRITCAGWATASPWPKPARSWAA